MLDLAVVLQFSPDYLAAKFCNRQTATSGLCSLPLDQYLPSPRPSGGSLVIIGPGTGCQGQWLFWEADGAVGPDLVPHMRPPQRRVAPCCHHPALRRGRSCGRSACRDGQCLMRSLLFREPTHPGRYAKFKTPCCGAYVIKSTRQPCRRPDHGADNLRYEFEIATSGRASTDGMD